MNTNSIIKTKPYVDQAPKYEFELAEETVNGKSIKGIIVYEYDGDGELRNTFFIPSDKSDLLEWAEKHGEEGYHWEDEADFFEHERGSGEWGAVSVLIEDNLDELIEMYAMAHKKEWQSV